MRAEKISAKRLIFLSEHGVRLKYMKNKKAIYNFIFILIFMAMIIVPTLLMDHEKYKSSDIDNKTLTEWPGFSFALHLLRVHGFCFAQLQYSHAQAFTAAFILSMQLYSQRCKTEHRALQWRFLRLFPLSRQRYQTDTIDYNATCATLERITAPQRLQRIPDTSATPDTAQVSTDALL